MKNLSIQKTTNPMPKPAPGEALGFGRVFTDHMLIMEYDKGIGWHDARIVPYGPISMSPASTCLHYAQETFEGLKAYAAEDGRILLFRPEENFKRLNLSNDRICIPRLDEDFCVESLKELIKLDKEWVPREEGSSLYIRPFVIGNESRLGVKDADNYLYMVLLSPSGAYYPEGLKPVKIYVEENFVRAVRGGMGFAKTGGNYASSMLAQHTAHEKGYSQVLWLDGVERKYIEEVGAMNVMFLINDTVVTPKLTGSILPGITRKSCIELLKEMGWKVEERLLSVDELEKAMQDGTLKEAWGCGTAAVISPIGELRINGTSFTVADGGIGKLSQKLYDTLTDIQWGKAPDTHQWTCKVD